MLNIALTACPKSVMAIAITTAMDATKIAYSVAVEPLSRVAPRAELGRGMGAGAAMQRHRHPRRMVTFFWG